MELAEPVERINQFLSDTFGIDTSSDRPIWRVVWANDQREKRLTQWSDDGKIFLLYPTIRELPKYQHAKDRYVLERLCLVPEAQQVELAGEKTSYEPMWTFQNKAGEYLPPRIDVSVLIIKSVYASQGKGTLRYLLEDPDTPENKEKRLKMYQEYIYADETDVSDALQNREGVVVPSKFYGEH